MSPNVIPVSNELLADSDPEGVRARMAVMQHIALYGHHRLGPTRCCCGREFTTKRGASVHHTIRGRTRRPLDFTGEH